jgi:hypothetical protein
LVLDPELGLIFRTRSESKPKFTPRTALPIRFMCVPGTGTVLIYFFITGTECFPKRKEPANTGY